MNAFVGHIRQAEPPERDMLQQLQYRASIVWDEYRDLLIANPDAVNIPLEHFLAARVFVAERRDAVVGFGVTLRRADGDAELDGVFVEPAAWRAGFGTLLVREAERRAYHEGATRLHVTANPRAELFYLACGFAFSGAAQTRFGAARRMTKCVGDPPSATPA